MGETTENSMNSGSKYFLGILQLESYTCRSFLGVLKLVLDSLGVMNQWIKSQDYDGAANIS